VINSRILVSSGEYFSPLSRLTVSCEFSDMDGGSINTVSAVVIVLISYGKIITESSKLYGDGTRTNVFPDFLHLLFVFRLCVRATKDR